MIRYALAADGRVFGVMESPVAPTPRPGLTIIASDTADVGWFLVDGQLTSANPMPTTAELEDYLTLAYERVLAAGRQFDVDAGVSGASPLLVLTDGGFSLDQATGLPVANMTRPDLILIYLFGQQSPSGTKKWLQNVGGPVVLTGTQCISLALQTTAWIGDVYDAAGAALLEITSGAITSLSQIDDLQWPG